MTYTLKLYGVDVSDADKREAQQRFCDALEQTLGDAEMVAPVYLAYRRIVGTWGEQPDLDNLSEAEKAIFGQWQAAETAAVTAAFGTHRYMGDADYEIVV
ncbi:hypothetical protein [uncultured Ramlibacter sp.]|uniref:hypothetical protein n=1 Tax=uncultured Ramlibacter sp. TaxID=260755 RepID=UPI0026073394|nr:hypothetical protein [uncultured Ramlibacter sp.]